MGTAGNYESVIADLQNERKELQERISDARGRLAEVDRLITGLQVRAKHRVEVGALAGRAMVISMPHSSNGKKRGSTTAAVLNAVREREGQTAVQLAKQLDGTLTTKAKDQGKLVHSVLGYLRERAGSVRRDHQGRYFIVKKEDV